MWGLISLLGVGIGLANDAIEQNRPYYGTNRDMFKNNPRQQQIRKDAQDVVNKKRREWEEEHGRPCPW